MNEDVEMSSSARNEGSKACTRRGSPLRPRELLTLPRVATR